ncbi:site-specific DNA-methyltransferase, partial [Tetragenococcus muriaticus]
MTDTALLEHIKRVIRCFPEYWEQDALLKNKLIDDIRSYKTTVIKALLANELIKDTYSLELDGITIFKVEDFVSMLRYKNYWEDSYTKYSNEIGLTNDGKYLNYTTDVVLDFPHKDGVLEGGMTKEDVGKREIYYHNVLAKKEIDTLLAPKVLSNMKKYNANGEQNIIKFNDTDNLIIKGNNLIALHTLKERYAGKVKLIYIDPPYNTGGDSFKYNDRFNRSTWLTFNRVGRNQSPSHVTWTYGSVSGDSIMNICYVY